ncbi:MAG: hypothetical protein JRF55_15845 [Deltaproteobacteria bacterium]|nr:hypothetical protein [Deltaproteobacteria bacterium]
MALARIVEALISTSVHLGRLDAFRMVRANRDVTTRELSRGVRLAAVALFVWSLADMTSGWRPLGRVLHRVLTADLGLGLAETGVTLSDLLAFFFILWLSWITARFVSFVLGEEVLPRLHMQTGVPYALTTFTRYAIIAIGFVAAVSMIGIPVDRLTIVLTRRPAHDRSERARRGHWLRPAGPRQQRRFGVRPSDGAADSPARQD